MPKLKEKEIDYEPSRSIRMELIYEHKVPMTDSIFALQQDKITQ